MKKQDLQYGYNFLEYFIKKKSIKICYQLQFLSLVIINTKLKLFSENAGLIIIRSPDLRTKERENILKLRLALNIGPALKM